MGRQEELQAAFIELQNPGLPAERLADIATAYPELHEAVGQHPNCYPELQDWLAGGLGFQEPVRASVSPAQFSVGPDGGVPPASPIADADAGQGQAENQGTKLGRTKAFVLGLAIGLIVGAALSVVAVLWVLPGLFGSVIG